MAGLEEYYVDTQTGKADLPLYDRWFKWAKFSANWTTVVLGLGTLVVHGARLSSQTVVLGFFVLFILLRTVESVKETVPLFFCGHSVAWMKGCCSRKDQAREADKLEKYISSLIAAPLTAGLALALFARHLGVLGCLAVGVVSLADFAVGAYVVYTDEWRKDFHRVRQRPDEFELDDNLDPYEAEEEAGLVEGTQKIHLPTYAQHHQNKLRSFSEKGLHSPALFPQKSGQIKSQTSDIAVLYASDDEPQDHGPPH